MKRVLEKTTDKRSVGDAGAVLIEIAFVLPLLALLFLMVVDVGLAIREHQLLQNAAREGARFSSLPANWISPLNPLATEAAIKQRVIDYCLEESITVNSGDITVNQNYPIPISGGLISRGSEIIVTYNRQLLILGAPILPTGSMQLTGRSVFKNLYGI